MLAALILFTIDCVFLTYVIYHLGIDDFWLEVAFHVWIMAYLISGVIAWAKLRRHKANGETAVDEKPAGYSREGYGATIRKEPVPDSFTVKLIIPFLIVFYVFLGIGVFIISIILIEILAGGNGLPELNSNDAFGMMMGIVWTGIGVFISIIFTRWRLTVTGRDMEYTPYLGKARMIHIADLDHIIATKSYPGISVYDKQNKKLFVVYMYHRRYDLLIRAISPHIKNAWEIPQPIPSASKRTASGKTGEYLRGDRAGDIVWYLKEYTDGDVDDTVLTECKSCGRDAFSINVDDVEGAIEVECSSCNARRRLLDGEERWGDCEPVKVECPECGSTAFNVGVGFAHRQDGDVKWVYIGARCLHCGLLGCPADWEINDGPTDDMERNV